LVVNRVITAPRLALLVLDIASVETTFACNLWIPLGWRWWWDEMSVALSFAGLIDDLGLCGNAEDAWRLGRKWLSDNGVIWCHYAHVAGYRPPHERRLIRFSSLPETWLNHYDIEDFSSVDPAVQHCLREAAPLVREHSVRKTVSGKATRFLDDMYGAGFRGSVMLPLHLPGAALGSFSLITAMQGDEFLSWHRDRGQWVTLAAHAVDAQLIKLVSPLAHRPKLSPRERECLRWLAAGLRYDRIAERLGISLVTVELHVANAKRKLDAKTREQALAIAVALRLLDL